MSHAYQTIVRSCIQLSAGMLLWSGAMAFGQQAAPLHQAMPQSSAYGMCAHVSRGEHAIAKNEFKLMKAAGVEWVRTDFDWANIEKKQGEWDFKLLDETVDWAEAAGIKVLPILDYDVKWASPAHAHLDEWNTYVRTVVTRYKDRIRVWEVWNEQNSPSMWRDKTSAANYTKLLKATYETIKAIDPNLTVLYGGTAGLPWDFIEESYKAGANQYFDVMNVHPYRYPAAPELTNFVSDMAKLRSIMTKYGAGSKPVWITEIGWPTHGSEEMLRKYFNPLIVGGLEKIKPGQSNATIAVLNDPDYGAAVGHVWSEEQLDAILGSSLKRETVTIADLGKLNPNRQTALLLPLAESVPGGKAFDAIEKYVRNGGVVISLSGLPFYYEMTQNQDGMWQKDKSTAAQLSRLHFAWDAWWTNKKVPQIAHSVAITPDFKDTIQITGRMHGTRFVNDSALKPGDVMIPVAAATENDFAGVCSAVYKFNSDLKGGLIISAFEAVGRGSTEKHQGEVLPRTNLMAFHAGVERLFWYEFQAPEGDMTYNEDHFGIVHRDLSPKPAYTAMAVLNKARPVGSVRRDGELKNGNVYQISWKRPDGQIGWALWTPKGTQKTTVRIDGKVLDSFNHLGEKQALSADGGKTTLTVGTSVLYIIGPSQVTATPQE